jgi:Arc/MetJ family transcription regulator
MSRTSIEIDDALIERVMRRHDFRTKGEAVERALRHLDIEPLAREEILELEGTGWDGDVDEMRANREPVKAWIRRE